MVRSSQLGLVGLQAGIRSNESATKVAWPMGMTFPRRNKLILNCVFHRFPSRKFINAVKRVRDVNQKLVAFERGFISEGGIPDREWYRHLGVAPGKWLGRFSALLIWSLLRSLVCVLGYGATTLPALTESLTLDKNSTLATYEAARLNCLIKRLVQEIRV